MKKLNSKGFAITGILYTLFILFLLVLLSSLGGLQTKRTLLERSIIGLEDIFAGDNSKSDELVNQTNLEKIAPVDGKYIFHINTSNEEATCTSYLKKGDSIDRNIHFIPKDCNDYTYDFSFNNPSSGNIMTLREIYNFEEES